MQPSCTGEPWNAPAWYFSSASPAVIRPSLRTPTRPGCKVPGRGAGGAEDLLAGHGHLDGVAGFAGEHQRQRAPGTPPFFPPKPPPISDAVTRSPGHLHPQELCAVSAHDEVPLGPCTTARPGRPRRSSRRMNAVRCSPGARAGCGTRRSTTTSASAKPASTSPCPNSTTFATLDGVSGAGSTPAVIMSSCSSGASGAMALLHVHHVRQHLVAGPR